MFEKEAEEYFETECLHSYADTEEQLKEDVVPAFQKGAEFGYNKAKEEMQEQGLALQSDMNKTIEQNIALKKELNKANEWHYVKDGDYPKDMENVLINAFDYGINTCYVAHRLNGKWRSNCSSEIFVHVIAWKEIVLPELPKEIKGNEL